MAGTKKKTQGKGRTGAGTKRSFARSSDQYSYSNDDSKNDANESKR
jgi:hypothetical protein